jgi:hypothetical protein
MNRRGLIRALAALAAVALSRGARARLQLPPGHGDLGFGLPASPDYLLRTQQESIRKAIQHLRVQRWTSIPRHSAQLDDVRRLASLDAPRLEAQNRLVLKERFDKAQFDRDLSAAINSKARRPS